MKTNLIKALVGSALLSLFILGCGSGSSDADAKPKGPDVPIGQTPAGAKNPQQAAEDAAAKSGGDKGGDDKGN